MKRASTFLLILTLVAIALAACRTSAHSGAVAMVPYVNEDLGIRGTAPVEGWSQEAVLIQEAHSLSGDELASLLIEQTDLIALPRSTGTYQGAALTWTRYSFVSRIKDQGEMLFRIDLAVAEKDAKSYFIALAALSSTYEANRVLYETVFTHALYALEPIG